MLTVPAVKIQQFKQEFFLLNLAAADVQTLVRFEVLEGGAGTKAAADSKRTARHRQPGLVNWTEIEKRVSASEQAFQRPILRKKVAELAAYYLECRDDNAVPAIPGAILLVSDGPVKFLPHGSNPFVGLAQLSEAEGTLRVLDGQHRLLALAALLASENAEAIRSVQVPAILFSSLPAPSVVEMFVTINSKHTRLNQSLLFSLKGRQLYPDPLDSAIHDALKALNASDGSALAGHIRMLGVGPGKVPQAALAQELRRAIEEIRNRRPQAEWFDELISHLGRFYDLYFREVARAFDGIWTDKKHSVRSGTALRAFIQASPEVALRVFQAGGDPQPSIRTMLASWPTQVGAARFETAGAWRAKLGNGGRETTRLLSRELIAAFAPAPG